MLVAELLSTMATKYFHLSRTRQLLHSLRTTWYFPASTANLTTLTQIHQNNDLLKTNDYHLVTNVRGMRRWNEKILRLMYWRKRQFDAVPAPIEKRSSFLDWNYESELYAFANRLKESELSLTSLQRLFTHRSYISEEEAKRSELQLQNVPFEIVDNSELIVNGRQFMEQFIPNYLRYFLHDAPEECIKSVTGYLLSEPVLADIAKWIGCIGKTKLNLCFFF